MNKLTRIDLEKLKIVTTPKVDEVSRTAWQQYHYKNELVAPAGYEFTGEFRQGFEGEHVLGRDGQVWDGPELEARLILRKIEEPKSMQKSFLFKYVGYVTPKKGQYFDTYRKGDKFEKANADFVNLYDTYEKIDV